jgi:hypothetical protein
MCVCVCVCVYVYIFYWKSLKSCKLKRPEKATCSNCMMFWERQIHDDSKQSGLPRTLREKWKNK